MNERQRSYSAPGSDVQWRWEWVAYTPSIAVCWEHCTESNGQQTKQMVGLHIYGQLDGGNIRAVPVKLIYSADPSDYPSWPIELPDGEWYVSPGDTTPWLPTGSQVVEAFEKRGAVTFNREAPAPMSSRGKGEPIDDFYARVARSYQYLASTTGKPTAAIALQAGVKRTTAARWVHEARKRDLLPKTTAGKVTR